MKPTTVEILTIGNELLCGFTQDTNAQWLSTTLSQAGFKVVRKTTVGDKKDQILTALVDAERYATIILITGGLGPTSDDLTKCCLATFFNCEIAVHEEALIDVASFFNCSTHMLTETNKQQASLPVCCQKITNTLGTAPGMWFEKSGKIFVSMPGVPSEMMKMMKEIIIPKLQQTFKIHSSYSRVVRTVGIGESFLADKISSWENALPNHIQLSYLPSLGEVKLRLTSVDDPPAIFRSELTTWIDKLQPLIGEHIYGYENDSLESVVGTLLCEQNLSLSTAESCTGGYVAHLITRIPGSSKYYQGGVIAYDNKIKIQQLGVAAKLIEKYGAVSQPVVEAMAHAVRILFDTNIGVSISGIAGPSGAVPGRPIGTVWIALSSNQQTFSKLLKLSSNRLTNIYLSSSAVLDMLRRYIIDNWDK